MSSVIQAAIVTNDSESPELEARRSQRLARLSVAALLPWIVLTTITALTLTLPTVIVTPLMWIMLLTIWSYPLVWLVVRFSARRLQHSRQFRRATMCRAISAAIGAFLFGMLAAPPTLYPFFADGYFALMGSCLLSITLAGMAVRRLLR